MVYFRESYNFSMFQSRSNIFQGGVGGGPNANFYRNPYNVIFQGGGSGPPTPTPL